MSNQDNIGTGGHPQIGTEKTATIKSKFEDIKKNLASARSEIERNIDELKKLENDKDSHHAFLKAKTEETKKNLLTELDRVQVEMTKHLDVQRLENAKLQKLITALKGEKTVLMNKLIALQRRISDMEAQVGQDDIKFL